MFIAPNIYKVPKTRVSNVYILEDKDGLILIDTGLVEDYDTIIDFIRDYLDADEDYIKTIVITHGHTDHTGALPDLLSATDAKVIMHKDDVNYVKDRVFFGKDFKPDVIVENDLNWDGFGGLKIITTPGHTLGSISIYKENNFLVTGDTIVVDKNSLPSLPKREYTKDMSMLAKSVNKLSKLKFNILLPGHGRPILERGDSLVKKLIENIQIK